MLLYVVKLGTFGNLLLKFSRSQGENGAWKRPTQVRSFGLPCEWRLSRPMVRLSNGFRDLPFHLKVRLVLPNLTSPLSINLPASPTPTPTNLPLLLSTAKLTLFPLHFAGVGHGQRDGQAVDIWNRDDSFLGGSQNHGGVATASTRRGGQGPTTEAV